LKITIALAMYISFMGIKKSLLHIGISQNVVKTIFISNQMFSFVD